MSEKWDQKEKNRVWRICNFNCFCNMRSVEKRGSASSLVACQIHTNGRRYQNEWTTHNTYVNAVYVWSTSGAILFHRRSKQQRQSAGAGRERERVSTCKLLLAPSHFSTILLILIKKLLLHIRRQRAPVYLSIVDPLLNQSKINQINQHDPQTQTQQIGGRIIESSGKKKRMRPSDWMNECYQKNQKRTLRPPAVSASRPYSLFNFLRRRQSGLPCLPRSVIYQVTAKREAHEKESTPGGTDNETPHHVTDVSIWQ